MNNNLFLYKVFWGKLNQKLRRRTKLTFLFALLGGLIDTFSIGSIYPLISILSDPEGFLNNSTYKPYFSYLSIVDHKSLAIIACLLYCILIAFSGAFKTFFLKWYYQTGYKIGHFVSISIFAKYLESPYIVSKTINSNDLMSSLLHKVTQFINSNLLAITQIVTSVFSTFSIVLLLLYINYKVAFVSFAFLFISYGLLVFAFRKKISRNSKDLNESSNRLVKDVSETCHSLRDIKLKNLEPTALSIFKNKDLTLRNSQSSTLIISAIPRHLLELLVFVFIAALMTQQFLLKGEITSMLPILATFALAGQRLLPQIQSIYSNLISIKGSRDVFLDLLGDMSEISTNIKTKPKITKSLCFEKEIELVNVAYKVDNSRWQGLSGINLKIKKGEKIALIGPSGCGKSTLLDIISGLVLPTTGQMFVDGNLIEGNNVDFWKSKVASVPQDVFLFDDTVVNNVTMAKYFNNINESQVNKALNQSALGNTFKTADIFNEKLGENGSAISGGQRQRLGIARALYSSADVLLFDEVTSALDDENAQTVVDCIGLLEGKTVIIVTHDTIPLEICDSIYEVRPDGLQLADNRRFENDVE